MRLIQISLITLVAACGGASSRPAPAHPLGVSDHLVEAQRHDQEAEVHEALAAEATRSSVGSPYVCGDRVLGDQTTSGGERLGSSAPCWSAEASAVDRHRAEANRLRKDASEHRHRAADLLAAERASCAGMPADELAHTPFAHHEDVAAVAAELEAGALRGARIRFRKVEGLDADWLRQAIACHRARAAALGWDATYMSYDPAALDGVKVTVSDEPDGVLVIVRAADDQTAEVAYRRAEELVDPQSAGPQESTP